MDDPSEGRAEDLLDSIFRVATELVRGERASLMLREDSSDDFVIAHALGLADDVKRAVRVRPGEGVAGHVVASKRSLLVRGGDAPFAGRGGQYRSDSFMSVPIMIDDAARGVLNVTDRYDGVRSKRRTSHARDHRRPYRRVPVQQEQGEACCGLRRPIRSLALQPSPLRQATRGRDESGAARRTSHGPTHDRRRQVQLINDRFGHRIGDQVLKSVAAALKQAVRLYDVPTRYGGDEFAVILPDADTEVATRVARRVLEKAETVSLPGELRDAGIPLGLSIGIATFPRPAGDANALVEAADSAMYRAKQAGGGIRVWEHAFADGPRGAMRPTRATLPPAPYLSDPARLATRELQALIPVALAQEFNVAVVGHEGQVLTIAFPAHNPGAVDTISKATGYAVYPVFSNPSDLEATRRRLAAA